MEAYKSTCTSCGRSYFWTGYKTGLGKTPAQLEEMRRAQEVCKYCGAEGLETGADHESPAGRMFDEQLGALFGALFGNADGRSGRGLTETDDGIDPRYAEGHAPGAATRYRVTEAELVMPAPPQPLDEFIVDVSLVDLTRSFFETLGQDLAVDGEGAPLWFLPLGAADLEILWHEACRGIPEGPRRLVILDRDAYAAPSGQVWGAAGLFDIMLLVRRRLDLVVKHRGREIVAVGQPFRERSAGALFPAEQPRFAYAAASGAAITFVPSSPIQENWLYLAVRK